MQRLPEIKKFENGWIKGFTPTVQDGIGREGEEQLGGAFTSLVIDDGGLDKGLK